MTQTDQQHVVHANQQFTTQAADTKPVCSAEILFNVSKTMFIKGETEVNDLCLYKC